MRNIFTFFVFALLAGACGSDAGKNGSNVGATAAQETAKPAPPVRKNIVFFGNSLTAAFQLDPALGFPALIQKKIDSLNLRYQCINAGLSGETTADGVNRIEWVLQQPVDVFVLELGANDALRGLPVAESQKNLQAIFDKVKSAYPDCKLVLTGMLAPPNLGAAYANAFRDMYPRIAKANNAALVPFLLEGVAADPALNLEDGIHPNPKGHTIVAETVWRVLKTVL
jgi:acyl-CoA thioesterase I